MLAHKLKNTFTFASLNGVFAELTSLFDLALPKIKKKHPQGCFLFIGVARFELTTFCSQSRRSTRLSYTPSDCKYSKSKDPSQRKM